MAQERIEIHFKPKGDEALIRAIKILDVVTKELKNETSRYRKEIDRLGVSEEKRRKGGMFDTKNLRLQSGAFATLRSKLLLYSFAVGLGSAAVAKLTAKFAEQEKAEKKLFTALGKDIRVLKNYASALQQVTTFGDEEIINAQALVAAYTDDESQIKKATEATLDFAAAKGVDLQTATDLIAKTMNSSTNALSRYGIEVEGVVGSTSRLDSITRSITRLYEGQAQSAALTFSGKLTQLGNVSGDVNEQIGLFVLPVIEDIADAMTRAAKSTLEFFTRLNELPAENLLRTLEQAGVATEDLIPLQTLATIERLEHNIASTSDEINRFVEQNHEVDRALKGVADTVLDYGVGFGKVTEFTNTVGLSTSNYTSALEKLKERQNEIRTSYTNLATEASNLTSADTDQIEEKQKLLDQFMSEMSIITELIIKIKSYQKAQSDLATTLEDTLVTADAAFTPFKDFLEFLDTLDSRVVTLAENFANTFGDIADITQQNAQKRIDATNAAADAEIAALRKSRRHQKKSAEEQARIEKEIKDNAEKDNAKRREETNKILLAEFLTNQSIKVRETIMATQKAYMEAAPNPFLQGLVIAQGALAVGVIAAQKPPKFAAGGLVGGRRHSQGGTMIEAEQGEFVMNRSAVDSIGIENLNRMNRGGGGAINVSFNGNVLSDDFIELEAIPKIQEAIRRGAELEVN